MLKAVEEATEAYDSRAGAEVDAHEKLVGKARNLTVRLPPVNVELERLQKLKSKLSDRIDVTEVDTRAQGTTLGDVVLGAAQGDDGLPVIGNYRGVSVSLLRKANTIARHIDTAPMKSELRSWLEEAQHLSSRADRVLEECADEKPPAFSAPTGGYASRRGTDASQAADLSSQQLSSMTTTIRNALSCLEMIKSVLSGASSLESLSAIREEDLLVENGTANDDITEDKTDKEALEDVVAALRSDVGMFLSEVKINPQGFGRQPAGGTHKTNIAKPMSEESEDEDDNIPEYVEQTAPGPAETYDFANLAGSNPILSAANSIEKGIAAAAQMCGLSLSAEQVKEILTEFYRQPKLSANIPMKKKQKLRLERRYIDTLKREEEQVRRLNLRVQELTAEVDSLKGQLEEAVTLGNPDDSDEFPESNSLQAQNARFKTVKSLVEALSQKRVKDLETKAAEMEEQFNTVVRSSDTSHVLFDRLRQDYDDLLQAVQTIRQQWAKKEEELSVKEKELEVLQQGRRRDDQLWRARLTEVVKTLVQAMQPLPGAFAGLHTTLLQYDQGDALELLNGLLSPVLHMISTTIKYAPHESFRVTLTEVLHLLEEYILEQNASLSTCDLNPPKHEWTSELLEERTRVLKDAVPPLHKHCNRLCEQLQEKIEMLATENRSKFRESRYIKNVIQHACTLVEQIITGNSPLGEEGLGDKVMVFPPPEVVAQDKDYAYFWLDQKKMLEETLTSLNLFVLHGGAKPNSVNSLVSVLGYWKTNSDQPQTKPCITNNGTASSEAFAQLGVNQQIPEEDEKPFKPEGTL